MRETFYRSNCKWDKYFTDMTANERNFLQKQLQMRETFYKSNCKWEKLFTEATANEKTFTEATANEKTFTEATANERNFLQRQLKMKETFYRSNCMWEKPCTAFYQTADHIIQRGWGTGTGNAIRAVLNPSQQEPAQHQGDNPTTKQSTMQSRTE